MPFVVSLKGNRIRPHSHSKCMYLSVLMGPRLRYNGCVSLEKWHGTTLHYTWFDPNWLWLMICYCGYWTRKCYGYFIFLLWCNLRCSPRALLRWVRSVRLGWLVLQEVVEEFWMEWLEYLCSVFLYLGIVIYLLCTVLFDTHSLASSFCIFYELNSSWLLLFFTTFEAIVG